LYLEIAENKTLTEGIMGDNWMVVGNCAGNKWLLKLFDGKSLYKGFKTGYFENVKVGDTLTQVSELEDATPEEIKNAGIEINDEDGITITPESELGLFFIGKLEEELIKSAVEKIQKTDKQSKKASKKKTSGKLPDENKSFKEENYGTSC
jgi:hypothetical protein